MNIDRQKGRQSVRKTGKTLRLPSAQTVPISKTNDTRKIDDQGKLSLTECKSVLGQYGATYTDEQVALVRQTLYALAEVDYGYHAAQNKQQKSSSAQIIPISSNNIPSENTDAPDEQQTSHSLHPRIYRRAG